MKISRKTNNRLSEDQKIIHIAKLSRYYNTNRGFEKSFQARNFFGNLFSGRGEENL